MAFRFVHAADLHLGCKRWLVRQPECEELRRLLATADQRALAELVELCLREQAAFLLLAGDVLDGWCRDYRVTLQLAEELRRLGESGCSSLLVLGNHDVRQRTLASLLLPQSARLLGLVEPETLIDEAHGVALHGVSGHDGQREVTALFPEPISGLVNVGLLHTSAEGAAGHAEYAPCSRVALRRKGYDYWALGHVHQHEVVWREPYIVYPGNLQARSMREVGPKGAVVVEVAEGAVRNLALSAIAPVRFERVIVEVAGARSFPALLDAVERALQTTPGAPGQRLVVDVTLEGADACAYALEAGARGRERAVEELRRAHRPGAPWLHEVTFRASECGLLLSA